MKLIYCPECHDVVRLELNHRQCKCGKAYGHYLKDGLQAVINTTAVPLGFNNFSLMPALENRPASGMGENFEAFVIPVECPTIRVVDYRPESFTATSECPFCHRIGVAYDGRAKTYHCHFKTCGFNVRAEDM